MSPGRWTSRIRLPIILLLPLLLSACAEDNPVVDDGPAIPEPDYLIERGPAGEGVAVGWSQMSDVLDAGATVLTNLYHLPGLPFRDRVEIRHEILPESFLHDWRLGRDGGPWRELRVTRGDGGDWAWVERAWGDFDLRRNLVPADSKPLPVDPLAALSYALLGRRWDQAGRPATLDLPLIWIDAKRAEPDSMAGRLVYDGELEQDGFDALAFHLELAGGTLFFKLMAEFFPMPLSTWWDRDELSLRYWPGLANLSHLLFDPEFPAASGYSVAEHVVPEGSLSLAAQSFTPAGEGPFRAVLLVADEGPADRDNAALFGHLAHRLALGGWLVYRYDKPGTGQSTGDLGALDLDGRRRALAAVWQALRADPAADQERTILLGHGEGAALALERASVDPDVQGVVALSPDFYDPAALPSIPEAQNAPGDYIEALGLNCFVDKYRDLLVFDSAEFLATPSWFEKPVLLYRGDMEDLVSWDDLEAQAALLDGSGADLTRRHWLGLDHFLNDGRADDPPDPELVDELLLWLTAKFGESP